MYCIKQINPENILTVRRKPDKTSNYFRRLQRKIIPRSILIQLAKNNNSNNEEELTGEEHEEDIYEEEDREKLEEEEDEITPGEEGFMKGYEEGRKMASCAKCGKAIVEDFVEKEINNEIYRFCSNACANSFRTRKRG